jgi:hypothetical protein
VTVSTPRRSGRGSPAPYDRARLLIMGIGGDAIVLRGPTRGMIRFLPALASVAPLALARTRRTGCAQRGAKRRHLEPYEAALASSAHLTLCIGLWCKGEGSTDRSPTTGASAVSVPRVGGAIGASRPSFEPARQSLQMRRAPITGLPRRRPAARRTAGRRKAGSRSTRGTRTSSGRTSPGRGLSGRSTNTPPTWT